MWRPSSDHVNSESHTRCSPNTSLKLILLRAWKRFWSVAKSFQCEITELLYHYWGSCCRPPRFDEGPSWIQFSKTFLASLHPPIREPLQWSPFICELPSLLSWVLFERLFAPWFSSESRTAICSNYDPCADVARALCWSCPQSRNQCMGTSSPRTTSEWVTDGHSRGRSQCAGATTTGIRRPCNHCGRTDIVIFRFCSLSSRYYLGPDRVKLSLERLPLL